MKTTLAVLLSLLTLISYTDNNEYLSSKSKVDSFNSSNSSFVSNKKIILKGTEYKFEEIKIEYFSSIKLKEKIQKRRPGINNYFISFLDENSNILYQMNVGDPFNLYTHDVDRGNKRVVVPKKNPYLEIAIPTSINPVSLKVELMGQKKMESISNFSLLK